MSEGALGPLVLVVGPSGAGKDSLIEGARRLLAGDPKVHFARRVITRPAIGEEHDTLSPRQFDEAERAGAFILSWRAHGLAYGIPASVQARRRKGTIAVANVSRSVVDRARRELQPVRVVAVTAPVDILVDRLERRGRESPGEVLERLPQAEIALPRGPDVTLLVNDGPLERAVAAFLEALRRVRDQAI